MMSVSNARSASEAEGYYQHLAQEDEYYVKNELEPPGQWLGSAAEQFGFSGEVGSKDFKKALIGVSNHGEPLTQNSGKEDRRAGWDCTFSAEKDVSALWAMLPDGELKDAVEKAHHDAVDTAFHGYLEQNVITRTGKGGKNHEKVAGLIAAKFDHSTSRALDPQLHSHIFITNQCVREDGSTGTIESYSLYQHQRAAGTIYRAELAHQLQRLGVHTELDETGKSFRIVGMSDELRTEFSTRRNEIEEALKQLGTNHAAAAEKIALATRDKKELIPRDELFEQWTARGNEKGFSAEDAASCIKEERQQQGELDTDQLLKDLTEHDSYFDERALVTAIAGQLQQAGGGLDRINGELEQLKLNSELVTIKIEKKEFLTTRAMLLTERSAAGIANKMAKSEAGPKVTEVQAQAAFKLMKEESGHEMTAEQKELAKAMLSKNRLTLGVGDAGTGKTSSVKAARIAAEAAGYKMLGCALAGKAAGGLQADAGIESNTIDSMLIKLNKGEKLFNAKTILVCDEAGMVGSQKMQQLIKHVEKSGAKLVLIGDAKQLQPVNAGGIFKKLVEKNGASQLTQVFRQKEDWLKEAVTNLGYGNGEEAISAFEEKDLLHTHKNTMSAAKNMVDKWVNDGERIDIKERLMLAGTKSDVYLLNQIARKNQRDEFKIFGSDIAVKTEHGERNFAKNDRLLFTKNNPAIGVKNGNLATVVSVKNNEIEGGVDFKVKLDSGDFKSFNTKHDEYKDIDHGYAVTVHKSQGATVDRAYFLTNERMNSREWGYVGVTRSREDTHIFTTEAEMEDRALVQSLERSRQKDTTLDHKVIAQAPQKRGKTYEMEHDEIDI